MNFQNSETHIILTYFQHMAEKVAARMRQHHYQADHFFIGLKTQQGWLKLKTKTAFATNDGKDIYQLCQQFMDSNWQRQGGWQVQVTALNPLQTIQADLFHSLDNSQQRKELNTAMDDINNRYGEFALAPARLLDRSSMPNVISPAWKPTGHRKTI